MQSSGVFDNAGLPCPENCRGTSIAESCPLWPLLERRFWPHTLVAAMPFSFLTKLEAFETTWILLPADPYLRYCEQCLPTSHALRYIYFSSSEIAFLSSHLGTTVVGHLSSAYSGTFGWGSAYPNQGYALAIPDWVKGLLVVLWECTQSLESSCEQRMSKGCTGAERGAAS